MSIFVLTSCGGGDATTSTDAAVSVSLLEFAQAPPENVIGGEDHVVVVRARTSIGSLAPNAEIRGTVLSGGGGLIPALAVTDGAGLASFVWRMGRDGGEQRVEFRAEVGAGTVMSATRASRLSGGQPLGVGFGSEQFANIPAGSYSRGSTSGESDEKPVRMVTITRAFQLQRTEVTYQQWRAVMGTNKSEYSGCDLCPVGQVSWLRAQEFITRLNQQSGLTYRLPTEAEWEYAARAGTTGEWYGPPDQVAWYSDNSNNRPQAVATKLPNAWGLYDMLGNVWEWIHDWYSDVYYAYDAAVDPPGPPTGTGRVLRGGSWVYASYSARAAFRTKLEPNTSVTDFGFRLARTP